jgi:hypothetical protein
MGEDSDECELVSSEFEESDTDEVLFGPKLLPGSGYGTVTSSQRDVIFEATACRAAVRKRDQWPARMLTIFGPSHGIRLAKSMAHAFIMESQKSWIEDCTEGGEDDPINTKSDVKKRSKAEKRKQKRHNRKCRGNVAKAAVAGPRVPPPLIPAVPPSGVGNTWGWGPSSSMMPPMPCGNMPPSQPMFVTPMGSMFPHPNMQLAPQAMFPHPNMQLPPQAFWMPQPWHSAPPQVEPPKVKLEKVKLEKVKVEGEVKIKQEKSLPGLTPKAHPKKWSRISHDNDDILEEAKEPVPLVEICDSDDENDKESSPDTAYLYSHTYGKGEGVTRIMYIHMYIYIHVYIIIYIYTYIYMYTSNKYIYI